LPTSFPSALKITILIATLNHSSSLYGTLIGQLNNETSFVPSCLSQKKMVAHLLAFQTNLCHFLFNLEESIKFKKRKAMDGCQIFLSTDKSIIVPAELT